MNKAVKELTASNFTSVAPVFAVSGLLNHSINKPLNYQHLKFHSDQHGQFDKSTGLFVASTPGLYLFMFNGTSWQTKEDENTRVELRVDGVRRAAARVNRAGRTDRSGYTLSISAMLHLNSGNQVGIYVLAGQLASSGRDPDSFTRFSCMLLNEDYVGSERSSEGWRR